MEAVQKTVGRGVSRAESQAREGSERPTLVVRNVDVDLLERQATALGKVIGPPARRPTGRERELLKGIWELLHVMLDDAAE